MNQNLQELLDRTNLDPTGRYRGAILSAYNGDLFGIVLDERDPTRSVELEVAINGRPGPRIVANVDVEMAMPLAKPLRGRGFVLPVFNGRFALPLLRQARSMSIRIAGTDIAFGSIVVAPPNQKLEACGLEGYCDSSQNGSVRGWIRKLARPDETVDVSIFIEGRFLSRVPASLPRQDIPDADGDASPSGFSVVLPKSLGESGPKLVEVIASESGLQLNRGRLLLDGRSLSFTPTRVRSRIETAAASLAVARQR